MLVSRYPHTNKTVNSAKVWTLNPTSNLKKIYIWWYTKNKHINNKTGVNSESRFITVSCHKICPKLWRVGDIITNNFTTAGRNCLRFSLSYTCYIVNTNNVHTAGFARVLDFLESHWFWQTIFPGLESHGKPHDVLEKSWKKIFSPTRSC